MDRKKGSTIITSPLIIAFGMMMISSLIVLSVKILIPYIWYEKLSSTTLKYLYVMEEYGYLTNREMKSLKQELLRQGFDTNKIKIKYTNYQVAYGEPIYLRLAYDYEWEVPGLEKKTIPMVVERTSVSKR